eukprot:91015_1
MSIQKNDINGNNNINGNTKPISLLNQISILTERKFTNTYHQMSVQWFRSLTFIAFSIFTGINFYNVTDSVNALHNKLGYTAAIINFMIFSGFGNILFHKKRTLYIRERVNNYYSVSVYCISDILCEIPWDILNVFVLCIISVLMVQSRPDALFEYFIQQFVICFAFMFSANSLAHFVSTLSSKYIVIFSIMSCLVAIFAMFSGLITLEKDAPKLLHWIYYISNVHYGISSLLYIEFKDDSQRMFRETIQISGNQFLHIYGFQNVNIISSIISLFLFGFVCRF